MVWVSYFWGAHAISQRLRGRSPFFAPTRGRVAQAFDLAGITNTEECTVLRVLGAGAGTTNAYATDFVQNGQKVASGASLPAGSTSSGQALAKNARTGHPRAQLPDVIRMHHCFTRWRSKRAGADRRPCADGG